MQARPSIQQRLFADGTCFGCGPANDRGLRISSFEQDDGVVASFTPWPEHDNGAGFLNGGIVATVLDCHSAAAMMVAAERNGWPALVEGAPPFVTSGIDVRYLRPSPLHGAVELWAAVESATDADMTIAAALRADGKVRAAATASWRRFRPR